MAVISGQVAEGYESVRSLFSSHFDKGQEVNAQCVAYVAGVKVVDLFGKSNVVSNYSSESLTNVFSSTKNIEAIAMATLVNKGYCEYTDLVSTFWPEYGVNDKGNQRIADVLRHESGLQRFETQISVDDIQTSNIKSFNSIGKKIESESPIFPKDSQRSYHSLTRGWILNEIFRRIHPEGHTIGEFVREELNSFTEGFIGNPNDEERSKIVDLESWSFPYVLSQSVHPFSTALDLNLFDLFNLKKKVATNRKNSNECFRRPPFKLMHDSDPPNKTIQIFNLPEVRNGEIPSANGHFSARGLAKLAAILANKGELNGIRLLSEKTWEKMHGEISSKMDVSLGSLTSFTQGGVNYYNCSESSSSTWNESNELRKGYYGWQGLGGSVFQWEPTTFKIGFSYVPNLVLWHDFHNMKGARLQNEVRKCAKALTEK